MVTGTTIQRKQIIKILKKIKKENRYYSLL